MRLCPGDIVQIMDLVVMIGHRFIALNFPTGLSLGSVPGAGYLDHAAFAQACPAASETDGVLPLFYPAPHLAHSVHARAFQIDDPPMAKKPDDQPALMQLGPSFIMGLASIFMVSSAVSRLMGGADAASMVPMIAMSCSPSDRRCSRGSSACVRTRISRCCTSERASPTCRATAIT